MKENKYLQEGFGLIALQCNSLHYLCIVYCNINTIYDILEKIKKIENWLGEKLNENDNINRSKWWTRKKICTNMLKK